MKITVALITQNVQNFFFFLHSMPHECYAHGTDIYKDMSTTKIHHRDMRSNARNNSK